LQASVLEVEKQAPGGVSFTTDIGGKDASSGLHNPVAQRLQLQEELAKPFADLGLEHSHTAHDFRRQQKIEDKIETARTLRNHAIPQFSDIVFEKRASSGISFVVPGVTQHAADRAPLLAQQLADAEACIITDEDLRTDLWVHETRRQRHLDRRVRVAKRFDTTSARWAYRRQSEEKCQELGSQLQLQQQAARHRRRQLMDRKISKAQMMAGLSRRRGVHTRSSSPLPKEFDSADKIPRDSPNEAMRSERPDFKLSQTPWDEEQQTTQVPSLASSITAVPSSSLSSTQQWQGSQEQFAQSSQIPASSLSDSMAQPRSEMHMGLRQEQRGLPEQHDHTSESPTLASRDIKNPFEKLSNNEVQQRQHLHMGISQATSATSDLSGSSTPSQSIQSTSQSSFPVTDRVSVPNMMDDRQRREMQMGMVQGQGGLPQQKDHTKEVAPHVQGQNQGLMMERSQAQTESRLESADKSAWAHEQVQGPDLDQAQAQDASAKPRRQSIFGKLKNLLPKRRESQGGAI